MSAELYIQNLLDSSPLREPLLRKIIQSLELPPGSHGLDAGCGIGLQTLLLSEAVGSTGHVTGLDILPELLNYGKGVVEKAGLSNRITFREGDVNHLPFEEDSLDWVWSADCIGYPAGELAPVLSELKRVVRPGGSLVLLGWSSQQMLPGYPLLEARLNGTCSGYLPFLKDKEPESNFMRALYSFRSAGLEDICAHTFVGEVQAPLKQDQRLALTSLFAMLWGEPRPEVSPEDWYQYQRLCHPKSANFILDIPDYYAFFTYSLFRGRVKKTLTLEPSQVSNLEIEITMLNRKLSARIAVILLVLHGIIEILGLMFINSAPNTLISFGGLTGALLEQNAQTVGIFGGLWGVSRLIAGWGAWSMRKWALMLGIILSVVTVLAAISIIPAGVADTFLAMPALILLLYAWFGNEIKEVV